MYLVQWYAREHVLLCLVPAFFIAGAVAVFVSQSAVMKYLGPKANKFHASDVALVSGTILAVCSCTILPFFAGIYHTGRLGLRRLHVFRHFNRSTDSAGANGRDGERSGVGAAARRPGALVAKQWGIRSVIGTKKTDVFVLLVMVMVTISGMVYGAIF